MQEHAPNDAGSNTTKHIPHIYDECVTTLSTPSTIYSKPNNSKARCCQLPLKQ